MIAESGYHRCEWARIVKRAGIGPRRFKDLRDTFGSQLVSAGIPLPYVSRQLGHSDVSVTARLYARWTGGDEYREPVRLLPDDRSCRRQRILVIPSSYEEIKMRALGSLKGRQNDQRSGSRARKRSAKKRR